MPIVKGRTEDKPLQALKIDKPMVVPTVEDLSESKKRLQALRTECREFVQFVESLPRALAQSRGMMHEIVHNIKTRAEKFSKVIG